MFELYDAKPTSQLELIKERGDSSFWRIAMPETSQHWPTCDIMLPIGTQALKEYEFALMKKIRVLLYNKSAAYGGHKMSNDASKDWIWLGDNAEENGDDDFTYFGGKVQIVDKPEVTGVGCVHLEDGLRSTFREILTNYIAPNLNYMALAGGSEVMGKRHCTFGTI